MNPELENALKIVESLPEKDKHKLLKIVIDDSGESISVEYCENCYRLSEGNCIRNYWDSKKYDSCEICKKTFCNDCIENSSMGECRECKNLYCEEHTRENMRNEKYCKKCMKDTDFTCSVCENIIYCKCNRISYCKCKCNPCDKCDKISCDKCEAIFCMYCRGMSLINGPTCINCVNKEK